MTTRSSASMSRQADATPLMQAVDTLSDEAIVAGALLPVEAQEIALEENGLSFVVRHVKALEQKQELPGGPRDPNFNPFLPPDPALTVGPIGTHHVAILNKYPVSRRHLVLARKEFAEQLSALELSDFEALAQVLSNCGGLGFYNGGAPAGASQRHKHVQWVPAAADNASLRMFRSVLDPDVREHTVFVHLQLPMRHCFVKVRAGQGQNQAESAQSMLRGYQRALETLRLETGADDLLPPFNMLIEDGWMLVVPRSQEHFHDVSLNALSFGGVLYVRNQAQIEALRQAGPLTALTAVACPL